MKTSWMIRTAVLSDAAALAECMHAAYSEYTARLGGEPLPPMTTDYEDEIRSYPVWVAESDGQLEGGLVLLFEEGYLTIANIAVHPRMRGRGLGRVLMEFAEAEAKRRGYRELRLATHVLLEENISLYSHLGWSEISRDEKRVYMKKPVG